MQMEPIQQQSSVHCPTWQNKHKLFEQKNQVINKQNHAVEQKGKVYVIENGAMAAKRANKLTALL